MSVDTWKLEKDLCRCCHSEGAFKNLAEPFKHLGQEEIYSEMLQECLDINLNPVAGPLCAVTYKICEECILRIREACSFKRQVLDCEQRFHDLYGKKILQLTSFSDKIEVKKEVPDIELEEDTKGEIHFMDNEDNGLGVGYNDDVTDHKTPLLEIDIKSEVPKKSRQKKAKTKERAKDKAKKKVGRPRKVKEEGERSEQKKDNLIPEEDMTDYTVLQESPRQKYSCNKCGTILSTKESMRMHIVAGHFNKMSFQCPLCDQKFKHKGTRTQHLAKKHNMEEVSVGRNKVLQAAKRCICDVCKKEFACRSLLTRHIPTHSTFSCPECAETFTRHNLVLHRFEVHGVSIPTCGICGYKNSRQCRVIAHQRKVHLKEKNIQCPQCDAKFFDTVQLRKHMVRHNPVRIYGCSFCSKKFPRLNALREHQKIHTGDKRKVCPICDERFVQKASLNYHMAKHHPEAS